MNRSWTRAAPTRAQVRADAWSGLIWGPGAVASVEVWRSAFGTPMGWHGVEAYGWFGLAGLALSVRRRFPLTTLVVEAAVFIVIGARLGQVIATFTLQIILFAALYTAWAWSRRPRHLYVVSAVVVVAMFGWLLWQLRDPDSYPPAQEGALLSTHVAVVIYTLVVNVAYFFGAMAWGHVAWRSARQRAQIAQQAEQERAQHVEARERAVQAERVRIARDLHDVVAHHVSGIGVQAAGVGRVLDSDPPAARRAIGTIEQSSRQAVAQMHQLVGLLRDTDTDAHGGGGRDPQPGLRAIAGLVCDTSTPVVEHREVGQPFEVPSTVGVSLFRIVQEAVANVRRHAGARRATVVVRYLEATSDRARAVEVEVVDDGRSRARRDAGSSGGYGLTGIRERTAMHGGEAEIGPRPDGGFRVRVRVPVDVS